MKNFDNKITGITNKINFIVISVLLTLAGCNSGSSSKNLPINTEDPIKVSAKALPSDLEKRTFTNHLSGDFKGMVYFAQVQVTSAEPRPFDPLLIPNREALVILLPESDITPKAVNLTVELNGNSHAYKMNPPEKLIMATKFDWQYQDKNRSYEPYSTKGWSFQIPWDLLNPAMKLSFKIVEDNEQTKIAHLNSTPNFLTNMDYEFINTHIFACMYANAENQCFNSNNPFMASGNEIQENIHKIAAREGYSQFPFQRLINSAMQFYVPYILYQQPDGTILKLKGDSDFSAYSTNENDFNKLKQIETTIGSENIYRILSQDGLGQWKNFSQQQFTQAFLTGYNNLAGGWGLAHCGGTTCRYHDTASPPYNHEYGHGWGLPDNNALATYEDFGYRGYSNQLIPNYALPAPGTPFSGEGSILAQVGDASSYFFDNTRRYYWITPMGFNYTDTPAVHRRPAIKIDEYFNEYLQELFGRFNHMQTKLMQKRLGDGIGNEFDSAALLIDYRKKLTGWWWDNDTPTRTNYFTQANATKVSTTKAAAKTNMQPVYIIHGNLATDNSNSGEYANIYPIGQANYGNKLAYTIENNPKPQIHPTKHSTLLGEQIIQASRGFKCLQFEPGNQPSLQKCDINKPNQRWEFEDLNSTINKGRLKLAGQNICLNYGLYPQTCSFNNHELAWSRRADIDNSKTDYRLQNSREGKFIDTVLNQISLSALGGTTQRFTSHPIKKLTDVKLIIKYQDKEEAIALDDNPNLLFMSGITSGQTMKYILTIPVSDNPKAIELWRNGIMLDSQHFPQYNMFPAVKIGAEYGYPKISPATLRKQFSNSNIIKFHDTNKCLKYDNLRVIASDCDNKDLNQHWKLFDKNNNPRLNLAGTELCIDFNLKVANCTISNSDTSQIWTQRLDLGHVSLSTLKLQERPGGKFIMLKPDNSLTLVGQYETPGQQLFTLLEGFTGGWRMQYTFTITSPNLTYPVKVFPVLKNLGNGVASDGCQIDAPGSCSLQLMFDKRNATGKRRVDFKIEDKNGHITYARKEVTLK